MSVNDSPRFYRPHGRPGRVSGLLLLIVIAATNVAAWADDDQPKSYRPILVPDSRKADLVRGHVPIRKERFHRLWSKLAARREAARMQSRVTQAVYDATLQDDGWVNGNAALNVEPLAGDDSLLTMGRLSLAGRNWRWREQNDPPVIGADAQGRIHLLTPQTDVFEFDWTLRGEETAVGETEFVFRLPPTLSSVLQLTTPPGVSLRCESGIVSQQAIDSSEGDGPTLWRIELGGQQTFSVFTRDDRRPRRRTLSVVQRSDYVLGRQGVEASITLQPRVRGGSLSKLELLADDGFTLIDAVQGGATLAEDSLEVVQEGAEQRWILTLPTPLSGDAEPIQLRAFARVEQDELWSLPQVRVGVEQWSSTQLSLELDEQVQLQRYETDGTHHQAVSRSSSGNLRLQFQHSQADGRLQLVVRDRPLRPTIASGLILRLDEERVNGQLVADVGAENGEIYSVTMRPQSGWRITSVRAEPPEALRTEELLWEVGDEMVIPLNQPATRETPIRLIVNGVQDYPQAGRRIRLADARLASFVDVESERRLVRIVGAEGNQAALGEDIGVFRLAPSELFEEEIDRLGGASGVLLEDHARFGTAVASLRPRTSSFDATIEVEVQVTAQRVVESYRIVCRPESLSLMELQVQLSQGRAEDVVWSVAGAANELTAERSESIPGGPETWLLRLRRPSDQPIEIIGRRESTEPAARFRAALADVVGAATQAATITVRSLDDTALRLTPDALDAAPAPPPTPGRFPEVRGVFRHEPPRRASLLIERLPVEPACWVWRMAVDAQLEASGVIGYQVLLEVENSGRQSLSIKVPQNTVDWLVYIDDEEAAATKDGDILQVPLPPERAQPTISLHYRIRAKPIQWRGRTQLTAPQPDAHVLRRDWRVSLPPGYVADQQTTGWTGRLTEGSVADLLQHLQREVETLPQRLRDERRLALRALGLAMQAREGDDVDRLLRQWATNLVQAEVRVDVAANSSVSERLRDARFADIASPRPEDLAVDFLARNGLALHSIGRRFVLTDSQVEATAADLETRPLFQWRDSAETQSTPAGELFAHRETLQFREVGAIEIQFTHRQAFLALEWCVLCAAIAFGLAVAGSRWRLSWLLFLAATLATLLAPSEAVFALRGSAMGLGLSLVAMQLARRWRPPPEPIGEAGPNDSTRSISQAAIASGAGVLILATLAFAARGFSQQPNSDAGQLDQFGLPSDRPNVLIPCDDQQQPVGDFYYVPTSLYRTLVALEDSTRSTPYDWLIREAAYTLRAEDTRTLGDIQALLTVHVFRPGVIRLPFPLPRVQMVYFDGRPIEFEGDADGIQVAAGQVGRHEIELVLAEGALDETLARYVMSVPAAARSVVTLDAVDGFEAVSFPSAVGTVEQTSPQRWVADLGSANEFQVAWPGLGQPEDLRELEAEEMYWLRVRPQSVSVDARLVLRPLRSDVQQFTMLVDPSLQLLNIGREQGVAKHEATPTEDDWVLHRFDLTEPIIDERTVELSFLWRGQSGLARIAAPRLRVDARYVRDRRLAFSVAQPLLWSLTRDDRWEPLAPAEFAAAWGDQGAPQAAFRAPREDLSWTLQTRYPAPNGVSEAELHVVVENDRLTCELIVDFPATAPEQFQHRIFPPQGFQLQSAGLATAGRDRSLRAQQEPDGAITLFHERPWTGDERVTLLGSLPRNGVVATLPTFSMEKGRLSIDSIRVYRRPDVSPLKWLTTSGYERTTPSRGEYTTKYGRLEAVLTRTTGEPLLKVRSTVKRPSATNGVIVTTLTRENNAWIASARLGMTVRNKSPLDVIRFDIPAEWTELELDPPWAFRLAPLPAPDRRQLIVYPDQPTLKAEVAIRGVLSIDAEERLRFAPEITPLDMRELRRYLVLPTRLENQRYFWELSGREEPPPEELRPELPAGGEYQSVLAIGQARASVQVASQPTGEVTVRLADYRLRWLDGRSGFGIARFDIEPSGAASCRLSYPDNVEVLSVAIDQVPHALAEPQQRQAPLPLGANYLPHRIDVVFRVGETARPRQSAPFLANDAGEPLECQTTLWTVESPYRETLRVVVANSEQRGAAVGAQLERLQSMTELVRGVVEQDSTAPQQDLVAWFAAWSGRMIVLRRRLEERLETQEALGPADQLAEKIRESLAENEVVMQQAAERFGAAAETFDESGHARDWERLAREEAAKVHLVFADRLQPEIVAVASRPGAIPTGESPWTTSILIAVAVGAGLSLTRGKRLRELAAPWPHAWLVAVGLLWWACMPLPWAGFAFAILMLISSLHSSWRATRR